MNHLNMKQHILIMALLSLFTLGCVAGCQSQPGFKSVGVEEFSALIENKNIVVVDVRRADEWAEGHIPQAQYNIDALQEDFSAKASEMLPQDKTIAIYCRSGRRSKAAATQLAKQGFDVIELDGGILSWQEKELPVVK